MESKFKLFYTCVSIYTKAKKKSQKDEFYVLSKLEKSGKSSLNGCSYVAIKFHLGYVNHNLRISARFKHYINIIYSGEFDPGSG